MGRPKGELSVRDPEPGKRLRLSIDFDVQKAGQAALERYGLPGGFVAMDPRSGEVIGLGSNPSYDPNVFAKGVRASVYKRLQDPDNGAPLANRATQGLYPTGSTFKLITATRGARERADHALHGAVRRRLADGRRRHVQERRRTCRTARVALPRALQVSSDVFFYRVGLMADQRGGEVIQKWARRLGLGRPTGIDLPGEGAGLVPTPEWRNRLFRRNLTDRPWTLGRQHQPGRRPGRPAGQPAADGGRLQRDRERRPHRDAAHRPARRGQRRAASCSRSSRARGAASTSPPRRASAIMQGLRAAANDPGGTSTPRVRGLPDHGGRQDRHRRARGAGRPVLVRRGGARRTTRASWSRSTIERGGFGAEAAAPAARRILAAYFGIKGKKAVGEAGERTGLMAGSLPHTLRDRRAALQRAARRLLRLDLLVLLGDARADRVQPRDARHRDRDRRPRLAGLLRDPPGRCTPSSGLALMLAARVDRLLPLPGAARRPLRGDDRPDPAGARAWRARPAARGAGSSCSFFRFQPSELGQGAADPCPVGVHHRPAAAPAASARRLHGSCCWRCCRHCW